MILAAAGIVAVIAGIRSTWSPCGVSMLSTVTPLGERGRGNRFRATAGWFVAGGAMGGVLLGALGALGAWALRADSLRASTATRVAVVSVCLAVFADACLAGRRAVGHHRQVNERWLDQYRAWVYGIGFGVQIGSGLMTYITTAAVYLVVVLGWLSRRPLEALVIGTSFGTVRGLAVLLGAGNTTPARLRVFHTRFARLEPWSRATTCAAEIGGAALLGGAPWTLVAVVAAAVGACAQRSVTAGSVDRTKFTQMSTH